MYVFRGGRPSIGIFWFQPIPCNWYNKNHGIYYMAVHGVYWTVLYTVTYQENSAYGKHWNNAPVQLSDTYFRYIYHNKNFTDASTPPHLQVAPIVHIMPAIP